MHETIDIDSKLLDCYGLDGMVDVKEALYLISLGLAERNVHIKDSQLLNVLYEQLIGVHGTENVDENLKSS